MNKAAIRDLSALLGYRFVNPELLLTALTHPSYGSDHHQPHYQRLEFLGDAVLELCVSRMLYADFPALPEGQLTRIRAGLVREETLCEIAREFGLGKLARLSVGEERSGGRERSSILSDLCEAVLGAVFIDGGFDEAFALVGRMFEGRIGKDAAEDELDAKSRLQEICQRVAGANPEYELLSSGGPPHDPVFGVAVLLNGEVIGRGEGGSKRGAQQLAAREGLEYMENLAKKPALGPEG